MLPGPPKETNVLSLFRLNGKVAVVTGGTRGIGWEASQAMAEAGANVAIIYTSYPNPEDRVKDIEALGVTCRSYKSSTNDPKAIDATLHQILQDFGKIDIVINNQNDPPTVLHNDGADPNHWISIRTVGTKSNRDGIGARVSVRAGGRRQIQEVTSGGSYLSQSDLRIHFGLGSALLVDTIEIRWPSGAIDELKDMPADRLLTVEEGKGLVQSRQSSPQKPATN